MKSTKLKLVKYLLAENLNQPERQIQSIGANHVKYPSRKPQRYKQYF